MRRINLDNMIHEASTELLKRTCYYCDCDYDEHHHTVVDQYSFSMCPHTYAHGFVSKLLMLGDAYLLDDKYYE